METVSIAFQIIIALGIANVWLLRPNRETAWRGGSAKNMKQEFEIYGLPEWFMRIVGVAKILLATALILGIWVPGVVRYAAIGMIALMLGAVSMHIKVGDPIKKSAPALSILAMAGFVAYVG